MPLLNISRNILQENINSARNAISEAQKNVYESQNRYNEYKSGADTAKSNYDTISKNQKNYTDIYNEARNQFFNNNEISNIKESKDNALGNINRTQNQISNISNSINTTLSQRGIFNSSARDSAISYQQNQLQDALTNYNTSYSNLSSDYNNTISRAKKETSNVASGNYNQQEKNISMAQEDWNSMLNRSQNAYSDYQTSQTGFVNANQLLSDSNNKLSEAEEKANQFDRTLAEQRRQANASLALQKQNYELQMNSYQKQASEANAKAKSYQTAYAKLLVKTHMDNNYRTSTTKNLFSDEEMESIRKRQLSQVGY